MVSSEDSAWDVPPSIFGTRAGGPGFFRPGGQGTRGDRRGLPPRRGHRQQPRHAARDRGPPDADFVVVIPATCSDTEMGQRNSFLHVIGPKTVARHGVNCVLNAMLPDILCKCKTRCTFIRFVHTVSG